VIAPGLRVLFCGINPGLYSGAVGHHFARPGNRFWPVLHRAGFTDRELTPFEEAQLLEVGLGITNLVNRTTAKAADLEDSELRRGAATLRRKAARYAPRVVAVLGVSAFRVAFDRPRAAVNLVSSHQIAEINIE
jgi:TDG/mug DNA glycosylase family protein